MLSRADDIATKDEVHGYANHASSALNLDYEGRQGAAGTVMQTLLIATSRAASIFAVCRDLADALCDKTVTSAVNAAVQRGPAVIARRAETGDWRAPAGIQRGAPDTGYARRRP